MEHLMQITTKEAIESALIMKRKKVNLTKYESIWESYSSKQFHKNYNKFSLKYCSQLSNYKELKNLIKLKTIISEIIDVNTFYFLRKLPSNVSNISCNDDKMHKVICDENSADIVDDCYSGKNYVLTFQDISYPQSRFVSSTEEVMCHRYQPYFLKTFPIWSRKRVLLDKIISFIDSKSSSVAVLLNRSMQILEKLLKLGVKKQVYHLSMASCLQLKHSISLLKKLLSSSIRTRTSGKKETIAMSLSILIHTKNLIRDIFILKRNILPIIECHNFVHLEDLIIIFKNIISSNNINISKLNSYNLVEKKKLEHRKLVLEREIYKIYSFLRVKYTQIIKNKKSRIEYMVRSTNTDKKLCTSNKNYINPIFIKKANKLVEKLKEEIKEIEQLTIF
ncbi:hypothetical protein [Candidatus Ichthyocystis hellenicum]|uniref:hypothetical protein n=1 Tax=Candidatus Ichthyocystis hellenicum TaxID=1561003 RepID=UPI001111F641|nr:hypothetical protein [Candidatus Ichthyocystis hellenicum]